MSNNWATSARLHHYYNTDKEETMESVLQDYGFDIKVTEVPRSTSKGENLIRCEECNEFKDQEHFALEEQTLRVCHECLLAKFGGGVQFNSADAPVTAAIKLFNENPKALAQVIRYFRKDFERLYHEELERVS